MDELLRKLDIPASNNMAAVKTALEEKRTEYLERLEHTNDEKLKRQLEATVKEIGTVLASLSWIRRQQETGLVRDSQPADAPQKEDFSALKGGAQPAPAPPAAPAAQPGNSPRPAAPPSGLDPQYFEAVAMLTTPNYTQGVELLKQLAQSGNEKAQCKLGIMYRDGERVVQNATQALHWLELAEKSGSAEACYNLAVTYKNGIGVPRNLQTAVHYYEKAAQLGSDTAAADLGLMYREGDGLPKDLSKALALFQRAAAGNPQYRVLVEDTNAELQLQKPREKLKRDKGKLMLAMYLAPLIFIWIQPLGGSVYYATGDSSAEGAMTALWLSLGSFFLRCVVGVYVPSILLRLYELKRGFRLTRKNVFAWYALPHESPGIFLCTISLVFFLLVGFFIVALVTGDNLFWASVIIQLAATIGWFYYSNIAEFMHLTELEPPKSKGM